MIPKILLVEDDLIMQGFATTVLESAGFAVDACGTMQEARDLWRAAQPGLVICDIRLPDGNGLDLCRELSGTHVPFLILTARDDLETRLKAFEVGAHDYIQKPFASEELLARVKVHLRLKKSHDELAKRNYDLELMSRARQDLTDMIIHDLKTPLTSIMGTMDLIKSRGLISDARHRALLDNAGTAADFMLLMLNDLLDIGHAEQLGLKAEIAEVDLRALFERLKILFASRCQRRGVALVTSAPASLATLQTDYNLVFRILVNLISNALSASRSGGEILLEASKDSGPLRLTVADRGPGVPDEAKNRIFEKYTTSHRKGPIPDAGSGIGLTFCRLAAYALKGKVWVEDRPGGGSLFILEINA